MPQVSVVVVSYQTPQLLRRCLERLTTEKTRVSVEILVVDNDSGDESAGIARSFDGVRVIETGENLGFGGGVNRGIKEARGSFFLVLNPDVEIHPGAVDTLVQFMELHPEVGIAAPKLLNTDGSLQYSCRRNYTLRTILLRRTFLGKLFPNAADLRRHLMLDYDHQTPRVVDWVAGAAMMVRRDAVDDVGPMEERYFLYFEDVDWCSRMHARGWPVHYVPQAVMTHHWQRASMGIGVSSATRRHIRSGLRFYDRWSGLVYLFRLYRGALQAGGMLTVDLVAFVASFLIAYYARQQLAFVIDRPMWPLSFYSRFFAASVLVYLAAFWALGLYRETRRGDWVDEIFRVGKAATAAVVTLTASTFLLKMEGYSRVIVLGSWPLVVALTFLGRRGLHAIQIRSQRDRWNLRRVGLLGSDPVLDDVEQRMKDHPELGWDPIRIRGLPVSGMDFDDTMVSVIKQLVGERISEVVVTPKSLNIPQEKLVQAVLPLRRAGFGVRLVSDFLVSLPPRARVESLHEISWLSLDRPSLWAEKFSKRLLDLATSTVFSVVGVLPFLVVLTARGVLGKRVWEPKAEWRGRWGETLTGRRLSGGGWFRSYPLLVKVLRGQMSLVGPRPLRPGDSVPGTESWHRIRERHRPGIIGPWSLTPSFSLQEEMQQELRYLEDWSPELDLKLLTRVALHRPGKGTGRGSASPLGQGQVTTSASSAPEPRAHSTGI